MIHIYIVVLHVVIDASCQVSLKSVNQFRRRFLKGSTIYGHGGHLGHVTWCNEQPSHKLPPPRRLLPSLGLGTTWVRQPRSGSCHYHTAATKCNVQPSRANPVGGKACSSAKGCLLRYILNTYSIQKVSSLKFAYFQGRLSRHITSPSEETSFWWQRWDNDNVALPI